MPYRVSRETLLLLAGLFWTLAGANVLRLGIRYWMDNPGYFLFKLSEVLVIFFVFLGFIFQNLYRKHMLRIIHKPEKEKLAGCGGNDFIGCLCPAVSIIAGVVYRRVLYRLGVGTDCYRLPFPVFVVVQPEPDGLNRIQ